MGACFCVDPNPDPDAGCRYTLASGSLKRAAEVVPRHLPLLRTLCDLKVPAIMLKDDVHILDEALDVPHGDLNLEWVVPKRLFEPEQNASAAGCCCAPRRELDPVGPNVKRILLYMHGGAFVLCTPGSLRPCTAPLANALDAALCVPEYRRPPEHSIEEAIEDGFVAYEYLLETYPGVEILIGGESAGGSLAATMLTRLRESHLPMPSKALLMSPWTDISGEGSEAGLVNTRESNGLDYLPLDLIAFIAKQALGELDPKTVPASPVYAQGDLQVLPPILVLYGHEEVLRAQIEHFVEVWTQKGARIASHGVPGGLHAPVLFSFCHGPSRDALPEVSNFFGRPEDSGWNPARQGQDVEAPPPQQQFRRVRVFPRANPDSNATSPAPSPKRLVRLNAETARMVRVENAL
mmetsp:Transcript_10371/g.22860  ORF Transcript_10371/g.22860 Transcript_10371/m.22860 type:complete len:407 (+) Transcript_10371:193-1413(+)|eukprot:CAMPEP_0206429516 /NCGR_PEP_ID=MMETSP0324_2-20121206/6285_1 /ASSEMBLY_ACC=CAM_ASM_000836 /TAXON_ID=2866 /ORGANISM="Crypthecodinium cohnii, Strain Seligo" /LENGTH=406 /DNA_ID=CAMNT_0053895207 /DNA_START=122 /DNA_END=1342 /DNA_ORIENTATION=+